MIRCLAAMTAVLLWAGFAQAQQAAKVTADRANVRAAASLDAVIVTTLPRGTAVTISERVGGWSRVSAAGKTGWIRTNLLEIASGAAPSAAPAVAQGSAPSAAPEPRPAAPPPAAAHAASYARPIPNAGFKDPGTATMLSLLGPGIGHLWAGDTKKGATLAIIGYGGLFGGITLSSALASDCIYSYSCSNPWWPYLAGIGAYSVAMVLGIMDAGDAATRMNATRGYITALGPVTPVVSPGSAGGVQVGLRLTLR